ncbi:MAG: tRNA uridine-5-carboxymethylaminomethyl(34) synthesis GTPase MnmE, partial [Oscillospiraceae bacterium]|nr:tRNA uridine-5-carboxymethylaminomethyl(34) synthesis GTPase MnmE [Oscillospiraceae bacterium]
RITRKIFRPRNTKPKSGYSGALGDIVDGGIVIDEAVVFIYRAPKSYTGEDVAELSIHGGMWVAQKVLRLCYQSGAVPAQPGEFTKRAFLNGRMDLSQAEAVMDTIAAQNDAALAVAGYAREGAVAAAVREISGRLLNESTHIAAWSDYPEEDLEPVDEQRLIEALRETAKLAGLLIATYDQGKILREGISAAIAGKPNVGKSTLMNLLSGHERSIVTQIPGTTRDIICESVRLGDIILHLHDTAGLRDTADPVERIGVERTREQLGRSQLILAVFDNAAPLDAEDRGLLEYVADKPCIAVVNKADLPQLIQADEIRKTIPRVVNMSAKNGDGCEELARAVTEAVGMNSFKPDTGAAIIANERQYRHLCAAKEAVGQAIEALERGMTLDAAAVCIDEAHGELLALTGERVSDVVVDEIFSRFCVGK